MPSKPKGSVSEETGEEAGLTHLFGCTGRSPDGSPCPVWVPTYIRIFGLDKSPDEDPYQAVIDVANRVGVKIQKSDISVCHRVLSKKVKRPLIVKFVRRQKFELMSSKKKLRDSDSNVYPNDDITFLEQKWLPNGVKKQT